MCLKCSENHNDYSYDSLDSNDSNDSNNSYDSNHCIENKKCNCNSCYVPKCIYDCSPPLWQTWPQIEIKKCVKPCYPVCNPCNLCNNFNLLDMPNMPNMS